MWNLGSVCLEIVLILMQDRCMVCMEHTICSEINLEQGSFMVCAQCTIGSEIVVEVPDGTPR